eukprot:1025925-Pyramimonas_sp.AAC.1
MASSPGRSRTNCLNVELKAAMRCKQRDSEESDRASAAAQSDSTKCAATSHDLPGRPPLCLDGQRGIE